MRRVAILVDGDFYIRRHHAWFKKISSKALKEPAEVVKDLQTHCLRHITRGEERLYRIFFYDCPPLTKKAHHPVTGKSIDLRRSNTAHFRMALHERLKQTRNLALRLGYLDERNARWRMRTPDKERDLITGKIKAEDLSEGDIVYYAQQKGVDMKIGLDIASLAYKQIVDKIILVAGDSDFVPAAKLARREGIEFILDPMRANVKSDLQEHIDGLNTRLPKYLQENEAHEDEEMLPEYTAADKDI